MASTGAFTPSTHAGPFPSARAHPDTPTSVSPVDPPLGGANAFKPQAAPNPTITLDPSLPSPTTSTRTPKSPIFKTTPAYSPRPLTGAAAMADDRRLREERRKEGANQTSPNPAISALSNLLGDNGMSKARDAAAAATTLSEPLAKAAKNIQIPDSIAGGENMQTSPVSVSSFGSLDSTTAATATASATDTAPAGQFGSGGMPVTDGSHDSGAAANSGPQPGEGFTNNRSQTFPVPAPPDHDPRQPTRVLSMPMAGYSNNNTPRSPSTAKRHKCPYCSTDFTRHHNLKSHLLTHSQEKPYECPTCQARFRRLHDLKRHTKLHTGERPHTCPKCGRKFARGDALARHNKGQGGCAGRRSSFGVDEDGEGKAEEGMDGLVYHGDGGDDERMDEDGPSPRRVSEPSSKGRSGSHSSYQQHSSTYPPVQGRPAGNNVRPMYPPSSTGAPTSRDPSGHPSPKTMGSSLSSVHFAGQQQAPPVFQSGGMTESPKPISPGQIEAQRHQGILEGAVPGGGRSPNMPQQAHQQYQQRGVGRGSSPMSLPPPVVTSHAPGPHLPSLPGLSNDMRMSVNKMGAGHQKTASQSGQPGPSMLHQQMSASGASSNQGSLSSHGPSSGGSLRDYFGGREPDIWEYIRNLEQRVVRGQEEANARIMALQEEVAQLRAQLSTQQQSR